MSDRLDLDFGHNEIDHGTSDDYYTPPFIFEGLGLRFEMDVCSPPNGESKGIFMPTVLIGIGESNIEAMRQSKLGRVR